jgi:hypothetical protein
MALPTTNLTFHVDASDTDNLFTTAGNPSSGTPTDGSAVQAADDDDGKDLSLKFGEASAEANWRTTAPLMELPCLDFSGTDWYNLYNNAGDTVQSPAVVLSTTNKVVLASIYVEAVATNDATITNNEAILADNGELFGLFLKNNAGAITLVVYNWDGNSDELSVSLSLNTSYVVVAWHTGGNLFVELYTSAGLATSNTMASGTTSLFAGQFRVGRCRDAISAMYQGRLGELAVYNAHDATDRANATTYFRDKWVPTPPAFRLVRFY